jgi:hypothetical protein
MREKSASKFGRSESDLPNIHLDSDGTEIDDEDYFQTLEPNAELIAVFSGEKWEDVSLYIDNNFCAFQHHTACGNYTLRVEITLCVWKLQYTYINHTRACVHHT